MLEGLTGIRNTTNAVSSASRSFVQNKGKASNSPAQSLGGDISSAATAISFMNPALGALVGLFGGILSFFGGLFG